MGGVRTRTVRPNAGPIIRVWCVQCFKSWWQWCWLRFEGFSPHARRCKSNPSPRMGCKRPETPFGSIRHGECYRRYRRKGLQTSKYFPRAYSTWTLLPLAAMAMSKPIRHGHCYRWQQWPCRIGPEEVSGRLQPLVAMSMSNRPGRSLWMLSAPLPVPLR